METFRYVIIAVLALGAMYNIGCMFKTVIKKKD